MSIEFYLGLLLAVPLSILGNVLTPRVLDYAAKGSVTIRGRRLKTILKNYRRIKYFVKNPNRLTLIIFATILRSLYFLPILGFILSGSTLLIIFASDLDKTLAVRTFFILLAFAGAILTVLISIRRIYQITDDLNNVRFFEMYEAEVLYQITKLGGNPEDLDKEETA